MNLILAVALQVQLLGNVATGIPELRRNIKLNLAGVSVESALREIARKADLPLTYNDRILPALSEKSVWLARDDIRTDEALDLVLRESGLRLLALSTGQIVVVKDTRPVGETVQATGSVSGTVTREGSEVPIAGARVSVEGTRYGATTAESGRFTIDGIPSGTYRLVAKMLGYAQSIKTDVRIADGESTTLDFQLRQLALALDQIVVSGTVDPVSGLKVPFTVAKLTEEDMPVPAAGSAASVIMGKVAGAFVLRGDDGPGSDADVLLRTPTSVHGDNKPLFVIDGVILSKDAGSLVDIESMDIESVEVIKGAAAASLYGSSANSGVISIITKRGSNLPRGKTKFSYRTEIGANKLGHTMPIAQNSHYYRTNADGYFVNSAGDVLENPLSGRVAKADRIMDTPWGPYATYNNIERFYNPGGFQSHTLSLSQNTIATNFALSLNEYKEAGVLIGNEGFTRRDARLNVDHRPREDLSLKISAYHMRSYQDKPRANVFFDLVRFSPDVDLLAKGLGDEPYMIQPAMPFLSTVNPLYTQWSRENWDKRSRTLGSISGRYAPLAWLTLDANVGYDRSDRRGTFYLAKGTKLAEADEVGAEGSYDITNGIANSYTGTFTGTVLKTVGQLTARTYFRSVFERSDVETISQSTDNFAVQGVKNTNLATDQVVSSSYQESRATGHMIATALDYKSKYIADLLVRHDGSSRFGPDARWSTYYRAAANWRISEEEWFRVPGVTEFQVRLSQGTAGGRPGFDWQYETFSVSSAGLISKGTLGNTFLRPELTTETELSVRAILKNRVSFDLSSVKNKTQDQIIEVILPGPYGFTSQRRNAGTIAGRTYEATVEARLVEKKNVEWKTNLVLDRSRHKVLEYDRPCFRSTLWYYCEGMQLGQFYTVKLRKNAAELADRHDASKLSQFQTNDDGLLVWVGEGNSYKDGRAKNLWGTSATIDGVLYRWGLPFQETDKFGTPPRFVTGDGNSNFNFGLGNSVRLGRFSFYGLVVGQMGADIYNTAKARLYNVQRHGDVDQSGKPDELRKPIDYYTAIYNAGERTDAFVEDGTFAKLTELSVRFSPRVARVSALQKLGISDLSIGFVGRNLFTLTNYSGYDPEVGTGFRREDNYQYPKYRTFTAEVRMGF